MPEESFGRRCQTDRMRTSAPSRIRSPSNPRNCIDVLLRLLNYTMHSNGRLTSYKSHARRSIVSTRSSQRFRKSAAQYKTDVAAAQNKITLLENEKADLRAQLDKALHNSSELTQRLSAMQAAFSGRETNIASALQQVEFLNSELASVSAERFKLVAAVQSEKRRQRSALNQQTSILDDKVKRTEALAETQEMQIKHLEGVRAKLDKRIQVLETLLKSEHEVAEIKIKRLTEELERDRSSRSDILLPP